MSEALQLQSVVLYKNGLNFLSFGCTLPGHEGASAELHVPPKDAQLAMGTLR